MKTLSRVLCTFLQCCEKGPSFKKYDTLQATAAAAFLHVTANYSGLLGPTSLSLPRELIKVIVWPKK